MKIELLLAFGDGVGEAWTMGLLVISLIWGCFWYVVGFNMGWRSK